MIDSFEHIITKNIKAFYMRRLFSPIIYMAILIVVWFVFPFADMRNPISVDSSTSIRTCYEEEKNHYVSATLKDLTFTGLTKERFGSTLGYYYYAKMEDDVVLILLTPRTCEQGLPRIEALNFSAQLKASDSSYEDLLAALSESLEWTPEGISSQLPGYYLSELDYNNVPMIILFTVYYGTFLYAAISLISYILYILFPVLSPPCQNLIVYGNPKKILEEAEEELATLPQLATEDMFITEHYFIVTSILGTSIVPIQEILWLYKYSTLHKFLWYHFSISYTLHIQAKKHLYIQCPKNIKSDIDGIMDYLAEANHDILVGFSEENRLKVQESQGKPFHIEKFIALLRRRI